MIAFLQLICHFLCVEIVLKYFFFFASETIYSFRISKKHFKRKMFLKISAPKALRAQNLLQFYASPIAFFGDVFSIIIPWLKFKAKLDFTALFRNASQTKLEQIYFSLVLLALISDGSTFWLGLLLFIENVISTDEDLFSKF